MRHSSQPPPGKRRAPPFRGLRKTAVVPCRLPRTRYPVLSFQAPFRGSGQQGNVMNIPVDRANADYWDLIAESYDRNFPETVVGKVQRDAVWHELDKTFQPGMRVLELNCGTGIDAVHLAKLGVRVVACDLSPKMIDTARQRLNAADLDGRVDFRVLDTEKIETLRVEAPFDGAFSNFSG